MKKKKKEKRFQYLCFDCPFWATVNIIEIGPTPSSVMKSSENEKTIYLNFRRLYIYENIIIIFNFCHFNTIKSSQQ